MNKDTIKVICTLGDYTLISYEISGGTECYCCAWLYKEDTKSWAQGHYCQTLESALGVLLMLNNSTYIKSKEEMESGVEYARLLKITSKLISDLDDLDICDLSDWFHMSERERIVLDIEERYELCMPSV